MEKNLKNNLILLLILSCSQIVFAADIEGSVYLQDVSSSHLYINKPVEENTKSYNQQLEKDYRLTPQNIHLYNDFNPYSSRSTSFTKEKTHGNFAFGSKQDSTFAPNTYTQTNTIFTKYQKEKFSINTSYQSKGLSSFEEKKRGNLMFVPEYKLNNHLTLQNRYTTNFFDRNRKNELVFSIKPFQDNRVNFDVGASQIYSESASPTRSQFNFSTKFRF